LKKVEDQQFKPNTYILQVPGVDLNLNITTGGYQLTNASFDEAGTVFEVHSDKPQIRARL